MNLEEIRQFADDRPTCTNDDLYQWSLDAEDLLRKMLRRIGELEQDNQEQCRLNAMGAEREARLMARVKELEKENTSLKQDAAKMLDTLKDALCSLEISQQSDYVTSKVRAAIEHTHNIF